MTEGFDKCRVGDEDLVAGVLNGEPEQFGVLVERYWSVAVALALAKVAERSAAEDIAQDSFIKAYAHLTSLKDRGRFGGWLSGIVAQEAINHLRAKRRRGLTMPEAADHVEAVAENREGRRFCGLTREQESFVRQSINSLPDKLQKVIIMRFVGGMSGAEIARQLGKRGGTVRVWLHRAYKILRKELSPLLEEVEI